MRHVVIIDKDSKTMNDLSQLVAAINFEPMVMFNLNPQNKIIRDEVAIVFMDVETKMINPRDVINFFNSPAKVKNSRKIPIVFMYSNANSKLVKEALTMEYEELLTKPFALEDVFKILNEQLDLSTIEYEHFTDEYRLAEIKEYSKNMEDWLEKFGAILE